MNNRKDDLNLREFFRQIVEDDVDRFRMLVEWSDKEKQEFTDLLTSLKHPYDKETELTKEKGDRLEKLVEFIICKSFFFSIYRNIRTETNEIDSVIVLSDTGKQALKRLGLSRDLIPIAEDVFLGECKNYKNKLGVTYVGKFYSLMSETLIPFGILFTQKGLTGNSAGYKDAYGLTKVLRMIEQAKTPLRDFFIITFTLDDYERMAKGETFFDLVKIKKLELQMAADYNRFINANRHGAESEVKDTLAALH